MNIGSIFELILVSQRANEGDLLVIAKRPDGSLLAIVAEKDTTIASQITWLFVPTAQRTVFRFGEISDSEHDRIEFASRIVLESIGIAIEKTESSLLNGILDKFGAIFQKAKNFSAYAQSSVKDVSVTDGPDAVLMAWMEREEILFRTFKRHIVSERLAKGFEDVDSFMAFSLSVHNRRKSRAGLALQSPGATIWCVWGGDCARNPTAKQMGTAGLILFPSPNGIQRSAV